jgi:hypothetical protein
LAVALSVCNWGWYRPYAVLSRSLTAWSPSGTPGKRGSRRTASSYQHEGLPYQFGSNAGPRSVPTLVAYVPPWSVLTPRTVWRRRAMAATSNCAHSGTRP